MITFPKPYSLQHSLHFFEYYYFSCLYISCMLLCASFLLQFSKQNFFAWKFSHSGFSLKSGILSKNFPAKTLHNFRYFPVTVPLWFSYYLLYNLLHLHSFFNWYIIFNWGISLVFWYKHDCGWKMLKNAPIGWQWR